jgi:hypothetical protein
MRYMFRPHRTIFRQHIFKESTALCTLSIVLIKYVIIIIIINFGVTGCLVIPVFCIAAAVFPIGCVAPLSLVYLVLICVLCTQDTTKGAAHPVGHRAAAMQKIGITDIL